MNKSAAVLLLGITLVFSGCGSNSTATNANINGTWSATLANSTLANMFTFSTHLTGNADGSLGTTNFSLTMNNTPCTFSSSTETGTFTLTGTFNGQVSGKFHYVIMSTGVEVNTITLDGTVSGGQISGSWTVSGATANCSGFGTFTMNPVLAPMMR
jgi:PBP1b-binding outer membrane lipoprotein LpoB